MPVSNAPPWQSRQRVSTAGIRVRSDTADPEDITIIEKWREAHRHVINSFQAILRQRTRGTDIIVAQRHKRRTTIFDKLHRYPNMQLGRMDDVAGCRLIFPNVDELIAFRDEFIATAKFDHRLKNDQEKYDYITKPKNSGYRGIHDIYEYNVRSKFGKERKGLLIELQYRTTVQHAWATCVETIGFLTDNQPKFDQGDNSIKDVLRCSSEMIARAHEQRKSCLPDISNKELIVKFEELDKKQHFLTMLDSFNKMKEPAFGKKKNYILMFNKRNSIEDALEIFQFKSATDALEKLFAIEKSEEKPDVVLVKADDPRSMRESFKNYFTDSREFVNLIRQSRDILLSN
ncbi:MAG: RelA/SpoT domain-containing protein [Geminicoccaceae bacterium]|nr:RelA/SpoT domain-containing protein [Geminicoccaceae bacterium]